MTLILSHCYRWLRRNGGMLLLQIALTLVGISFIVPFVWMLSTSLKPPGQIFTQPIQWIPRPVRWANYVRVFDEIKFGETSAVIVFFRNTMFIAIVATLGTLVSSTMVGFSLSRLEWWGRDAVFSMVMVTMMLPGVVTLVPRFLLFRDLQWIDTYLPLIVPFWLGGGSFYIFLLRQFFLTLPKELDEAAIVDGASSLRILWQILLPLSRPALASIAIFSFLFHYNNYMGPLIYLNSNRKFTVSLGLKIFQADFQGASWHLIMALSTMMLLPVIVLFFFTMKTFIQGIQMTGIAGR